MLSTYQIEESTAAKDIAELDFLSEQQKKNLVVVVNSGIMLNGIATTVQGYLNATKTGMYSVTLQKGLVNQKRYIVARYQAR